MPVFMTFRARHIPASRAQPALLSIHVKRSAFSSDQRCTGRARREHQTCRPVVQGQVETSSFSADVIDQLLADGGNESEQRCMDAMLRWRSDGTAKGFGAAHQVPKRDYTLEELRLNGIAPEQLLSPVDETLNRVRTQLQVAAACGMAAAVYTQHWDATTLVLIAAATLFAAAADQIAFGGGAEALALDSVARVLSPSYAERVAMHEAGHFMIAYFVGVLPKAYTLSSWQAFSRTKKLNVQAGTEFCDSAFRVEVASGRMSSGSLDQFTCIALAGVATEWMYFKHAEGGMADVQQLDVMLKALRFTQQKANSQVRWAVLNVVAMLRRHAALHKQLAAAMRERRSVGHCIALIERQLASANDI